MTAQETVCDYPGNEGWSDREDDVSTGHITAQVTGKVTGEVERLVLALEGEKKRAEIQAALRLKHRDHFRDVYLLPALEAGYVSMTIPKKYRLTPKGEHLRAKLKSPK